MAVPPNPKNYVKKKESLFLAAVVIAASASGSCGTGSPASAARLQSTHTPSSVWNCRLPATKPYT
jgi:hypothetical protein